MALEGVVVDGKIVLDAPADLPNGTKVWIEPVDDEVYEYPHPMAPYDRKKEIALLRESIEELKAGRGIPLKEAIDQISAELGLPRVTE
jgi:hypothetical protein